MIAFIPLRIYAGGDADMASCATAFFILCAIIFGVPFEKSSMKMMSHEKQIKERGQLIMTGITVEQLEEKREVLEHFCTVYQKTEQLFL